MSKIYIVIQKWEVEVPDDGAWDPEIMAQEYHCSGDFYQHVKDLGVEVQLKGA